MPRVWQLGLGTVILLLLAVFGLASIDSERPLRPMEADVPAERLRP